jgi:hypothetical protein
MKTYDVVLFAWRCGYFDAIFKAMDWNSAIQLIDEFCDDNDCELLEVKERM